MRQDGLVGLVHLSFISPGLWVLIFLFGLDQCLLQSMGILWLASKGLRAGCEMMTWDNPDTG